MGSGTLPNLGGTRKKKSPCSKYESLNAEEEIEKLKEEIKLLQRYNAEKITQLKEIEELKIKNLYLKQKLKEN